MNILRGLLLVTALTVAFAALTFSATAPFMSP